MRVKDNSAEIEQKKRRMAFSEKLILDYRMVNMRGVFATELPSDLAEYKICEEDKSFGVDRWQGSSLNVARETKPIRRVRRHSHSVRIFDQSEVTRLSRSIGTKPSEQKKRVQDAIECMRKNDGYRRFPRFKGKILALERLHGQFENFAAVIEHLCAEMTMADASRPEAMRFAPILLDGSPGIGKTAFVQRVAEVIGIPFFKVAAGGLQHAAVFTGSASHWSTSHPGEIYNLLSQGDCATAILLIDEVDKISRNSEYNLIPALLDLLEPESSRKYRDESLGVTFDASRLIILMTSNARDEMHPALLSRCQVFDIQPPTVRQKRAILLEMIAKFNSGLKPSMRMTINLPSLDVLAGSQGDIRMLSRCLRRLLVDHLKRGKREVVLSLPTDFVTSEDGGESGGKIGFLAKIP